MSKEHSNYTVSIIGRGRQAKRYRLERQEAQGGISKAMFSACIDPLERFAPGNNVKLHLLVEETPDVHETLEFIKPHRGILYEHICANVTQ